MDHLGVFGTYLLNNRQPRAKIASQPLDGCGHDLRHHVRALAAAKSKKAKVAIGRRSKGRQCRCDHLRTNRVAGERYFALPVPIQILERAKTGLNRGDARWKEAVGGHHATDLLVAERWYTAEKRVTNRSYRWDM